MKTGGRTSRVDHLVCPVCEVGAIAPFGRFAVRCRHCSSVMNLAVRDALLEIVRLADAVGRHACECGHPEMRLLPDGIYRCPACGAEVLPPSGSPPRGGAESGCGSCL